ncbi:dual specificity protein phosphatase 23 isoform X1 [Ursus americanus]|uniref:dual specificity protein phosphatase 23 isoform X1 n=1 Tax=Ursus americanus TaxID=9643 RepID=UPI001E679951|nr:dual specificity protein phosphatase 23 isoform X1 [Ursus americanus]
MGVQPPNFSWVLPGRLAGLALPRLPAHYQFLLDQGVRHLVSLTERGPPHSDSCPGLTLHRLRIPDFCPPGPEQIDRFVRIVDEANARGEIHRGSSSRLTCPVPHTCSEGAGITSIRPACQDLPCLQRHGAVCLQGAWCRGPSYQLSLRHPLSPSSYEARQ